jgi:hypothetical protein
MDNFYRDLKGEPAQGILDMSETQKYPLGCRFAKNDGRVFRYAKAGAADLVAGNLISSAALNGAVTTVQTDLTPAAAAAGAYEVTAAIATTEQPKNTFKDGWLGVTDGDAANAMGDLYRIKSHPLSATNIVVTLEEPLKRAITTDSRISLLGNLYKAVIQCAATPDGVVVGVCPTVVTTLYYCWLQTWGIANVLAGGAIAAGLDVVAGPDVGEVDDVVTTTAHEIRVGQAPGAIADTDSGFIFLQIMP